VERLARTFRETLRVLEQSLAVPRPRVSRETVGERRETKEPAGLAAPPVAEPVPPSAAEPAPIETEPSPVEAPSAPDLTLAASPDAPPPASGVTMAEAPADLDSETRPEAVSRVSAEIPSVPELLAAPAVPPAVGDRAAAQDHRAAAAPPPRSISSATPDVLRNIEEAALIRQRLPQHMAMLLRIPTNEVAQHSYKSPFRESREGLIGRLLDPQLTLEEAARILGVCPTTVRRYTNRGMLQCHRTPGNQRRFRMSDVLQFLEQYGDRIDRAAEAPQFEEAA
jgi:excisionase family DNA binding protein